MHSSASTEHLRSTDRTRRRTPKQRLPTRRSKEWNCGRLRFTEKFPVCFIPALTTPRETTMSARQNEDSSTRQERPTPTTSCVGQLMLPPLLGMKKFLRKSISLQTLSPSLQLRPETTSPLLSNASDHSIPTLWNGKHTGFFSANRCRSTVRFAAYTSNHASTQKLNVSQVQNLQRERTGNYDHFDSAHGKLSRKCKNC